MTQFLLDISRGDMAGETEPRDTLRNEKLCDSSERRQISIQRNSQHARQRRIDKNTRRNESSARNQDSCCEQRKIYVRIRGRNARNVQGGNGEISASAQGRQKSQVGGSRQGSYSVVYMPLGKVVIFRWTI